MPEPLRIAIVAGRTLSRADARILAKLKDDQRFQLTGWFQTHADRPAAAAALLTLVAAGEERARGGKPGSETEDAKSALAGIPAFEANDAASARALDLDVALVLGQATVPELSEVARFGTWMLVLSDAEALLSDVPGFWEVYLGQGVTGATLARLRDGSLETIGTARYTTRRTFTRNRRLLENCAVDLVCRTLASLHRTRELKVEGSMIRKGPTRSVPTAGQLLTYETGLVGTASRSIAKRLLGRCGIPTDRWRLFVGRGAYDQVSWANAIETHPPKGEYWADPFLFRPPGSDEPDVFFELLDQRTGKGRIAVGRLRGDTIEYWGDVLKTPYHLSYPFVFTHEGGIWMIPESHETRRLELWRCVEYPFRWILERTVLEGRSVADSSLVSHGGHWWLFTNEASGAAGDHNTELHIYQADSPLMRDLVPHRGNPVIVDARRARNGGRIHLRHGALMRPGQDNSHCYGYGLGVYRISELSLDAYSEEQVMRITPGFRRGLTACHHLDSDGDLFVFDGRREIG